MSEKKEIEKTETKASASIYEALVNARKGFKAVKKDAVNSFFKKKYASLVAIIEAVEDSLLENGLWFRFEEDAIDLNKTVNGGIITAINTIIYNGEGEEIITSHNYVIDELTPQGFGKASTYAQRYALSAALGIVGEDDEDGNKQARPAAPVQKTPAPVAPAQKTDSQTTASAPVQKQALTLEEIGKVEGVTLTEDDNIVTVGGKTFAIANDLRGLGFRWEGKTKTWIKDLDKDKV